MAEERGVPVCVRACQREGDYWWGAVGGGQGGTEARRPGDQVSSGRFVKDAMSCLYRKTLRCLRDVSFYFIYFWGEDVSF